FHLVDERIVGRKPKTLSFAQAAALPLTSITAWELLFDRLGAVPGKSLDARTLLIVGGAGGVGSILIQLARRLTGLTVVATASRPESQKWCLDLGAHAVIDHAKPMKEQLEKLRLPPVALVASLTNTDQHYKALADLIAPQGKFGLIDDPPEFNVAAFKGKAVSIHWESMFTRSSFQTPDMIAQHHLLDDVADLIDKGVLRTTLDQTFGTINAANLKRAHALIESGTSRGKVVHPRDRVRAQHRSRPRRRPSAYRVRGCKAQPRAPQSTGLGCPGPPFGGPREALLIGQDASSVRQVRGGE